MTCSTTAEHDALTRDESGLKTCGRSACILTRVGILGSQGATSAMDSARLRSCIGADTRSGGGDEEKGETDGRLARRDRIPRGFQRAICLASAIHHAGFSNCASIAPSTVRMAAWHARTIVNPPARHWNWMDIPKHTENDENDKCQGETWELGGCKGVSEE